MLDPTRDFVPPPSSPTISSMSSSDLDSASTGSFFHDRSTTLGTLMGVTFPTSFAFHATPSQLRRDRNDSPGAENLQKRRRRWWWGLCRDDVVAGESRRRNSASLAEFFEVERRFGDEMYGGAGDRFEVHASDTRDGDRALFDEERVLPPRDHLNTDGGISNGVSSFRFRASMGGLCNRGVA